MLKNIIGEIDSEIDYDEMNWISEIRTFLENNPSQQHITKMANFELNREFYVF
ncbi:MAG: hypothetical protein ACQESK_02100 [Bacteroidota bacterium]